jgi:hypothetical protein
MDLRGRDKTAFVREVVAEAVKIVGKYAPKTDTLRSWDIRGSNARLNRVFELNHLSYGDYPEGDSADTADHRGKQTRPLADEGPSRDKGFWSFCWGVARDVRSSRVNNVFARAPGNLCANAQSYQGSLA